MRNNGRLSEPKIQILYDGACPLCSTFAAKIEKQTKNNIELVDARQDSDLRDIVTRQGIDLDAGIVVQNQNRYSTGVEAMNELANLSFAQTLPLFRFIFGRPKLSKLFYPLLKLSRRLLLLVKGVPLIRNTEQKHLL
jgi:predicted DCC family thiol-disulfide oxidoreductase YuxK